MLLSKKLDNWLFLEVHFALDLCHENSFFVNILVSQKTEFTNPKPVLIFPYYFDDLFNKQYT